MLSLRSNRSLNVRYQEYRTRNFQIPGLNADDALEIGSNNKTRSCDLRQKGIAFPSANLNRKTRQNFGSVSSTLFFLDPRGKIVRQFVNFQTREILEAVIRDLVLGS